MAVFPASPNSSILSEIAHMKPIRGEIHVHADGERHDEFKKTLDKVDGLSNIQINTTRRTVGYFLHDKAEQLVET